MTRTGLTPMQHPGSPVHPDQLVIDSDDVYLKQLQAYADYHGVDRTREESCFRSHLLSKLEEKFGDEFCHC